MSQTILRTPFPSLTDDNLLSRGSTGQVFAISQNLVIKCPTSFINPAPEQLQESEESIEKIEREKSIYKMLMRFYHENFVRAILYAQEAYLCSV